MKNKIMQTIVGTFLGLLMLLIGTQTSVFGQEDKVNGQQSSALVGVWRNTVTLRSCQTGNQIAVFQSLLTFHEGGTMSESGAGAGAGGSPILRGPGHGVWQTSNPFHPGFAFTYLRFNADGTFAGTQRIRSTVSLAPDGNSFQSTATAEVLDANDNIVGMACVTTTATRFQ